MSGDHFDMVARYGAAFGWELGRRTVLVEGTTDADLFQLAGRLEKERTGEDLFAGGLTIVAAGQGDQGGARAVARELHGLRCVSRTALRANGRPKYRFIGLLDNDDAGRRAIGAARSVDRSVLEYRDLFRLRPVMPRTGNPDPKALERAFLGLNQAFVKLDWEVEDLLSVELVRSFAEDWPSAVARRTEITGRVHCDYTPDGKARFHRYVREYGMGQDVVGIVEVIRALRFYFGLQVTTMPGAEKRPRWGMSRKLLKLR